MLTETCIFCGNTFKLPDEFQGKKVKCPKCKELLGIAAHKHEPAAPGGDAAVPHASPELVSAPVPLPPRAPGDARDELRFDGEELVLETRPSVAALVLRLVVVVVAMVGVVIAAIAFVPLMWQKIVSFVVCCVLAGVISVWVWVAWASRVYMLTSSRMLSHGGVVLLRTRSMPLEKVSVIEHRAGPVKRLLGVGSVVAYASGRFSGVKWHDIDDAQAVAALVAQHVSHRYAFHGETEEALRRRSATGG